MAHLGIDLGTSNTLVASLEGNVPVIRRIDESNVIPSFVYIRPPEGHVLVGKEALDVWADPHGSHDLAYSFHSWKPMMGEQRELATLDLRNKSLKVTPEYLTQCMVEHIISKLTHGVLGNMTIESILVTVPHGWRRANPEKCRATRQAVQEAVKDKSIRISELTVSEPVAAAVYWIWEARQRGLGQTLQGKTVLICDVGGGTFDLSLVAIKGDNEPIDVIDAINNNIAGDYVDALLLARVCRKFNENFAVSYPTEVGDILNQLPSTPLLRNWYLQVRRQKQDLSDRFRAAKGRGDSPRPVTQDFNDDAGHSLKISLDLREFESCAQPFYQAGRELVRLFLARNKNTPPYAVLLAGGGSRMAGLQEHILAPALQDFFSNNQQTALEVLNRIPVNSGERITEAIALGAALVANGVVNVQERLLNDIGLIVFIEAETARQLNIPPDYLQKSEQGCVELLVSPILRRGTPLPAHFSSSSLPFPFLIIPGGELTLKLVIDDGSDNPWIQRFPLTPPEGGQWERREIVWEMDADTDGILTLRLSPGKSGQIKITSRFEHYYQEQAYIVIELQRRPLPPRVSLEQLRRLSSL